MSDTSSATAVAVRTWGLTCRFGPITAVDGLSLEVPAGKIFGVLGPNGAGKTTIIRSLLGLLRPTEGRAEVFGHDTWEEGDRIRSFSGVLLEQAGLYESLTAEENLDFYGRVWRLPARERRERVRSLLSHFGLAERRTDRVGSWSRGMKQRLAIARAVINRPRLVFLDEPTLGLDPASAAGLREDIMRLSTLDGTTVVLTTHNLAEAERVCDLVGIVQNGKLLACGAPGSLLGASEAIQLEVTGRNFGEEVVERLRRSPGVSEVTLANGHLQLKVRNDTDRTVIVRAIVEQGGGVEAIHERGRSLEDVYLKLVNESR